jgi:hypothetical protein
LNWERFAAEAPRLARLNEERMQRAGVLLVGTISLDGTPRISPVEPQLLEGELLLGMVWQSLKALDLQRDPRCLLHSAIPDKSGTDGEFKLRGRASEVQDRGLRERSAQKSLEDTGCRPEEPYHLFAVDIESASFVLYRPRGDQCLVRWRPGQSERVTLRRWNGSALGEEESMDWLAEGWPAPGRKA